LNLLDFILHSDKKLLELVSTYGSWVYGILFAIVFAETGFVVTPFLPGDSLLFATGALCAQGRLSTPVATGLLILAAFTGNAVNYTIGRIVGPRIFRATDRSAFSHRLLNQKHLERAHAFFEEYGGKAIILGRFVPVNLIGAAAWVGLCVGAGLLFGNIPIVKQNFSLVTIGIVAVSLLPMAIEIIRGRRRR
jgi:membrane-associated protein